MITGEATSPVRYYEDLGCWVVWGPDQIQAALQEARLSSETLDAINLSYLPADMHRECAHPTEPMRRWFVLLDGKKRTEARRAIQPMFSPWRIRQLSITSKDGNILYVRVGESTQKQRRPAVKVQVMQSAPRV
ncbi:hypothetical protein [Streptomyces sp. NPDC001678]|uniref:hypothetical protein n=1 Tax=Streptomyces sp. NPDC001678 TaxID=3364599 RepID=UPI00368DD679